MDFIRRWRAERAFRNLIKMHAAWCRLAVETIAQKDPTLAATLWSRVQGIVLSSRTNRELAAALLETVDVLMAELDPSHATPPTR